MLAKTGLRIRLLLNPLFCSYHDFLFVIIVSFSSLRYPYQLLTLPCVLYYCGVSFLLCRLMGGSSDTSSTGAEDGGGGDFLLWQFFL